MLRSDRDPLRIYAPALLLLGALIAVAGGFAHDLGIGGAPGFERREIVILGCGALVIAAGAVLGLRSVRQRLQRRIERSRESPALLRPAHVLLIAAWLGLLSGFIELLYEAGLKFVGDFILKMNEHVVWTTPAAYLVLFSAVALALLVTVRPIWPRAVPAAIAVFPLAMLAVWCPFSMQPWLGWYAVLPVVIGVAAQVAFVARRHPAGFVRLARRTLPWMAGLVLVGGLAIPTAKTVSEAAITARLPALPAGAPNVLLIVLDTVRADHLGFHGYRRPTSPRLDELAARSVVFEWAYSTSPWTLPSHATMFTGRYRHEIQAEWLRALDDEFPTLAEVFTAHGYATGGFVGNTVYCLRENGIARGFTHYEDFLIRPSTLLTGSSAGRWLGERIMGPSNLELNRNDADEITDNFLSWLSGIGDRPFFAFLNYFDAHAPYIPPREYATRFGPLAQHVVERWGYRKYTPEEMQGFIDGYDANVVFVDDQLRRLFAQLEADRRLENTLLIITGDHGEHFGEHDLMDHANSLYSPLLHVPLVISFPQRNLPALRISETVTLRDLPATILDLTGVAPNPPFPGHSFARFWSSTSNGDAEPSPVLAGERRGIGTPTHEPISRGDMSSILSAQWQLIVNGDGILELYDVRADPRAERDFSTHPEHAQRVDRMRDEIRRLTGK